MFSPLNDVHGEKKPNKTFSKVSKEYEIDIDDVEDDNKVLNYDDSQHVNDTQKPP